MQGKNPEFPRKTPQEWDRTRQRESQRVKVRTGQLLVSMGLFGAVFLGQGVFPHEINRVNEEILQRMGGYTDFPSAFAQLGTAISGEGDFLTEIEGFCQTVFGLENREAVAVFSPEIPENQEVSRENPEEFYENFPLSEVDQVETALEEEVEPTLQESAPGWNLGDMVEEIPSDLPATHSLSHIFLGEMGETPVMGPITSVFGQRESPFTGELSIHSGVDIRGAVGDPIVAWKGGTVERVGESGDYGLFLAVDHGQGVATFYAHCDEILVEQGQEVETGDLVARLGATGRVTGPHLHLELTWDDLYLDPLHYMEHGEILD